MTYDFQMPPATGPLHIRREARRAMGEAIERLSAETGYKFGPRGWAYYAEGLGLITKGEFDRFEQLLTDMRKCGELDPDVIEPDASRVATTVYDFEASNVTPEEQAQYAIDDIADNLRLWARGFHEVGYWDGLDYYVEMIVEKKDLVQIFRDTADRYNVRITNGKGDTDIHTRLAMLKRFRDHSYDGRRCILLAIGDHDPKGLHIVEGLHRTFMSCCNIKGLDWDDPDFEVVNIGLTEAQIDELDLMKIANLETGGGRDLSDPRHPDHYKLCAGLSRAVRRVEMRGQRLGRQPAQGERLAGKRHNPLHSSQPPARRAGAQRAGAGTGQGRNLAPHADLDL